MGLGRSGPGVRSRFLETPCTPCGGIFLALAQTASQFAVSRPAWVASDAGQRLWMSITGSSSIRRLKDCPVVVHLHEFAPVGGRATSGRDGRRLEWFAEVCQGLTSRGRSHPGLLPLVNLGFASEPAPAGRLRSAGCRRRRWGAQVETPPRPEPSASPIQSATYRGSEVFGSRESRRSSLLWPARRPYARPSRPLAACRLPLAACRLPLAACRRFRSCAT